MKIAHISDIHLGYTSGKKVDPITKINLREEDGYKALEECFEQIIAEGDVDTVVCTGDFSTHLHQNLRQLQLHRIK